MIAKNTTSSFHQIRETITLLNTLIEDREGSYSKEELRDVELSVNSASEHLNLLEN